MMSELEYSKSTNGERTLKKKNAGLFHLLNPVFVSLPRTQFISHHCRVSEIWFNGMSHVDTFDMKPEAGSEIRGEFTPIATSVPGVCVTEHLSMMARQMHHLAVVRSVHHQSADHRKAAYWNLTGHMPTGAEGGVVPPVLPTGAKVSAQPATEELAANLPRTISIP